MIIVEFRMIADILRMTIALLRYININIWERLINPITPTVNREGL